ncbi:hypothetical protein ACRCPS_18170 [Pseudomonas aeruginosa]
MNALSAIYLVELQELLLDNGASVKVPPQIADTVKPPSLIDTRYVRRWAINNKHVPDTAEVGVAI